MFNYSSRHLKVTFRLTTSFKLHGTPQKTSAKLNKVTKIVQYQSPLQVLDKDGVGMTSSILDGMAYVYDLFISRKQTTGKRPKLVVNMSLGAPAVIEPIDSAIKVMASAGMIIVVAAGITLFFILSFLNIFFRNECYCVFIPVHERASFWVTVLYIFGYYIHSSIMAYDIN